LCLLAEFLVVGCSVGVSVVDHRVDIVPIGFRYKSMAGEIWYEFIAWNRAAFLANRLAYEPWNDEQQF
jgi:hypothetical protein